MIWSKTMTNQPITLDDLKTYWAARTARESPDGTTKEQRELLERLAPIDMLATAIALIEQTQTTIDTLKAQLGDAQALYEVARKSDAEIRTAWKDACSQLADAKAELAIVNADEKLICKQRDDNLNRAWAAEADNAALFEALSQIWGHLKAHHAPCLMRTTICNVCFGAPSAEYPFGGTRPGAPLREELAAWRDAVDSLFARINDAKIGLPPHLCDPLSKLDALRNREGR